MWRAEGAREPVLEIGEMVGVFRIEAVLGEGGTGVVYRAVRESDGGVVALKVLRQRLAGDSVYRQRFLHEARAAGEVSNRHLVTILEAGEADGSQYLVSQYVPGRSLGQRIENEGPLSVEDMVRLVSHVADALDALHGHGLVHRDVKPANVLIDADGSAMLTDFGLAKGRAYTVLTRPGQVVGTLDYLAPELIRGVAGSPASDIYALGCLAYECLTGTPPFAGVSTLEVGLAHLEKPPPDPAATRGDVRPSLGWAMLQALEKDPEKRPTTATAYATLLRHGARAPGSD